MYSVLPAKMKKIDVLCLHPKIIAVSNPKVWRAFIIHELERARTTVNEENIAKLDTDVQKGIRDNDELNRIYLIEYLEKEYGVIPIVLPSLKRETEAHKGYTVGIRKWNAYYQMPSSDDAFKDTRFGIGEFPTRREAETVAIYKCFDIIEEMIK